MVILLPASTKTVPTLQGFVRPLGPYSHVVLANGFVFISGQSGLKPGQQPSDLVGSTVAEQTRQCLRNMEALLKALGGSLNDVVKVTVYLANPSDFKTMNDAYKESFPEDPPARSISRLGADVPNLLVSIDAIAVQSAPVQSVTHGR